MIAVATQPDHLQLESRADGRLRLTQGDRSAVVTVRQCFPWSQPTRYLSLRDDDEDELALISDTRALGPDSRAALERALAAAGFVLEITAVSAIEEEVEVFSWTVSTRQGARRFQTRLDDWPVALPNGAQLIRDVSGDLYLLRDVLSLDEKSRALLWSFVD